MVSKEIYFLGEGTDAIVVYKVAQEFERLLIPKTLF